MKIAACLLALPFLGCTHTQGPTFTEIDKSFTGLRECLVSATDPTDTLLYLDIPYGAAPPVFRVKPGIPIGGRVQRWTRDGIVTYKITYKSMQPGERAAPGTDSTLLQTYSASPDGARMERTATFMHLRDTLRIIPNLFSDSMTYDSLLDIFAPELHRGAKRIAYQTVAADAYGIYKAAGSE